MKKPFKNKKERLAWQKERFLTVGKLKEWLSGFPDDTLLYQIEGNTQTYQEIQDVDHLFSKKKDEIKRLRESLIHWYGGNSQKVDIEVKSTFRYVLDKDGICVIG